MRLNKGKPQHAFLALMCRNFPKQKKIANLIIPFELEHSKGDLDLHIQTLRKT